jgi:hypothetical protein
MNFGTLKDTYAKILVNSYITESKINKKFYKQFIKLVAENEILKTQFVVYKNIENGYFDSDVSAVEYLKENISLFEKYNKKDIIEENILLQKKLGKPIESKSKELHEAIHNLITLKKGVETVNTLIESFEVIKKWLTTVKTLNENSKEKPKVDANKFLNIVVKKYNDKYSNISEEEKKVIKAILSENLKEKETTLIEFKNETIDLLNKFIKEHNNNTDVKLKLYEAKDVINELNFNKETFKEDIMKVYELKNSLN